MLRFAPLALIFVQLLAGPGVAAAQDNSPVASPNAASGDFAGLVDIGGGRRLYLDCRGEGGPTVLLEAGYRSTARVWSDDLVQPEAPRTVVLPGVAAFTRVCLYERPGVTAFFDGGLVPSRSDPVPMPRTAESAVADLHALLQAARVPGPYVLVGHSFGGLLVRLFASTYPDEVVGMVLVDAWSEQIATLLTPAEWAHFLRVNAQVPPEFAADPDYETIDFGVASTTMGEAAATQPLRPMPLAVIARGQPLGPTAEQLGFSPDALERAWRAAQEGLATLVPNGRFSVAADSAHYVQVEQPELVIDAVRAVVDAVRDPGTWATPVASPVAANPEVATLPLFARDASRMR